MSVPLTPSADKNWITARWACLEKSTARSLTVISLLFQSTTHCRYRVYTKISWHTLQSTGKSQSSTAWNNGDPTTAPLSLGHALYIYIYIYIYMCVCVFMCTSMCVCVYWIWHLMKFTLFGIIGLILGLIYININIFYFVAWQHFAETYIHLTCRQNLEDVLSILANETPLITLYCLLCASPFNCTNLHACNYF